MTVVNCQNTIPTFKTVNGSSFIDLTLTTMDYGIDLVKWDVRDGIITSDHNAITFELKNINLPADPEISFIVDISNLSEDIISQQMTNLAVKIHQEIPDMRNTQDIDDTVETLQNGILNCIQRTAVKRKRFPHRTDRWTDEVERFRKIYMQIKELFYKNRYNQYTDHLYRKMNEAKKRFKQKLEVARQKSWNKFATEELEKNPRGVIYKLAAEKISQIRRIR